MLPSASMLWNNENWRQHFKIIYRWTAFKSYFSICKNLESRKERRKNHISIIINFIDCQRKFGYVVSFLGLKQDLIALAKKSFDPETHFKVPERTA